MTATTRRSYSRSSSFIVLACILFSGVESRSSSFPDKRSGASSFVRRDANVTTTSNSSSSTTAPSTSTTASSSTQSSNINPPTSTPIFSNASQSTIFFRPNSTSSQILSTTSLILRTSTLVVTSTSIDTSIEGSSSNTPLVNPTPSVTFVLTGNILPTSSFTDTSASPTLSSVSAAASSNSSSSFWKNKAATVAVFLLVALIACGVIVIFIIAFFRRRPRRGQQLHSQLFDRCKPDPTSSTHSPRDSIGSAPMDAFSTREVGNESPLFFPVSVTQPSHPSSYIPLSLPKTTYSAPVAFHNRVKRESAQPSIDSFYGAPVRQPTDCKIYAL